MEIELIAKIKTNMDAMPKSYRKIATYILANLEQANTLSITQLANKIGTYPPTITRFCQSLGFSGFPQFKFNIEKGLLLSGAYRETVNKIDSPATIKNKLLPMYLQCMENTISCLSNSMLEHIASVIRNSNRLYFFGHGGSGISAQYGQVLFMQVGIPCYAYTEMSLASLAANRLDAHDVAIGITSSGSAKTPVDAIRVAKTRNAVTIGITGFAKSHLARYSDILLCYNQTVEDVRLMHTSRLCEVAILGILQNVVLNRNFDKMSDDFPIMVNAIMKARYDET